MKIHFSVAIIFIIYLFTNNLDYFLIFFLTIFFHECGHILMIKLFSGKIMMIKLNAFGGKVDFKIRNIKFYQEVLINLGGVMVNLLIVFFSSNIPVYAKTIKAYNELLIFFNLLPIFPLDGYRIMGTLFDIFFHPSISFYYSSVVSFLSLIILFIAFIYLESLGILIVAIYLTFLNLKMIKERDHLVLKKIMKSMI